VIEPFVKAALQLPEPAFRQAFWRGLGLSVATLFALGTVLHLGLGWVALVGIGWIDWFLHALGHLAYVAMSWVLFPSIATLMISIFTDEIAEAVEKRHYPSDAPGRPETVGAAMAASLRLVLLSLLLNLLVLPLYLVPVVNLVVYILVNGILLGREYFGQVARRYVDGATETKIRKANRWRLLLPRLAIAGMFAVPLLNLLAPLLATAAMVHVFKEVQRKTQILV
jgi:uncharacterized protein involved in cysteine biosynthesis